MTPKQETSSPATLPLLEQRRLEASFIKPFLTALVGEVGRERAVEIVRSVVETLARGQGRTLRQSAAPGLAGLAQAWDGFAASGALEVEQLERTEERLRLRVTRCRYAEMYRELGLEEWGPVLSCGRDAPFAEGLCPEARLERTTPLMEGGPYCELLYTKEEK